MQRKPNLWVEQIIIGILLMTGWSSSQAELAGVLDPGQHPISPKHESMFEAVAPLDAALPWKQRFNGDETFNDAHGLATSMSSNDMSSAAKTMIAADSTKIGAADMDGRGMVKDVRAEQGKVKIAHGPIEKYGMPAMTMVFKVADPAMLEGIDAGQEINFNVDNTSAGFVVTAIGAGAAPMSMKPEASGMEGGGKMDAGGLVKAVRAGQGKVKIEHGPIEKYGMPGMTMMFKVQDPALLQGLEPGIQVHFDIDNTSGGFVITNIVPADK